MKTARKVTLRLLEILMAGSLLLPALLFLYAAWVNHREVNETANGHILRSLDVLHEHAVSSFESVDLAFLLVEETIAGQSDEMIRNKEEYFHHVLKRIADSLGVHMNWFFHTAAPGPEDERDVVVRAANRRVLTFTGLGITEELLSPNLSGPLEVLISTIRPGADSEYYTHEGAEAGLVMEGTLHLWVGDRRFVLERGAIVELTREMLHNPATINLARKAAPAVGITQAVYPVPQELKSLLLFTLLERGLMHEALVFTRTKHRANRLWEFLTKRGISAARIHGNRSQAQRTDALAGFKDGRYRVLVATDIAARGIDVEELGHVVNFDVPMAAEDYIHRVGRTARAAATGEAFTFVAKDEEGDIKKIERAVGKALPRVTLPDFDYKAKAAALEVQEYVILTRAAVRGVFSRPYYARDIVEHLLDVGRDHLLRLT